MFSSFLGRRLLGRIFPNARFSVPINFGLTLFLCCRVCTYHYQYQYHLPYFIDQRGGDINVLFLFKLALYTYYVVYLPYYPTTLLPYYPTI